MFFQTDFPLQMTKGLSNVEALLVIAKVTQDDEEMERRGESPMAQLTFRVYYGELLGQVEESA